MTGKHVAVQVLTYPFTGVIDGPAAGVVVTAIREENNNTLVDSPHFEHPHWVLSDTIRPTGTRGY